MLKLGGGAIGHFVMLIKIGLHLYLGSILDKSQSFGDEIPKAALSPQLQYSKILGIIESFGLARA